MQENWNNQLNMDWNDPEQWLMPKEESYSLGDIQYVYEICGYNALLEVVQLCPRCKEGQVKRGCGQYFTVAIVRGEPEHPNRPRNIVASIDVLGSPFE